MSNNCHWLHPREASCGILIAGADGAENCKKNFKTLLEPIMKIKFAEVKYFREKKFMSKTYHLLSSSDPLKAFFKRKMTMGRRKKKKIFNPFEYFFILPGVEVISLLFRFDFRQQ